MRYSSRGFTLIELLVVISLIGLLSSIVLASLASTRLILRDAKRKAELQQLQIAIELYLGAHADYPPGEDDTFGQGMDLDFVNSFIPQLVAEGYLAQTIKDPGNKFYLYVFENSNFNNIFTRQMMCGVNPMARAALWFDFEKGVSNNYRIWNDSLGVPHNAICFYKTSP